MKGKSLSFIGFLFLLLGVVAVIFVKKITSEGIIAVCGILFILSGIINLISYSKSDKKKNGMSRLLDQVANSAAVVFGICMLVFMSSFKPMVSFIFGVIIAVCALWQFFVLAVGTRPAQLPGWLYIFPLLMVAGSVYIFMNRQAPDSTIVMAMGISLGVLGLASLFEGAALGMANKRLARQQAATATAEASAKSAAEQSTAASAQATEKAIASDAAPAHDANAESPIADKPAEAENEVK